MAVVGSLFGVKAPRPDLFYCNVELKLMDNPKAEIRSPYDTLSGVVLINSDSQKCFLKTVRVALVGHAVTRFEAKLDHTKLIKVYLDENFIVEEAPENSGLSVYVLGTKTEMKFLEDANYDDHTRLPPGTHTYPFKIRLNGQPLPASFTGSFGQIMYKLVAIAEQGQNPEVVAANKKITYARGHFNLTSDPSLCQPFLVTKTKEKALSFFSKRPPLKLSLLLEKRGFVPHEKMNLPFVLENPSGETIVKMHVALVRKVTYYGIEYLATKKVSKVTRSVVVEKENVCRSTEVEIRWTPALVIPGNAMPTFRPESKSIEIVYSIEFVVALSGTAQLKGDVEIVMGTAPRVASMDRNNSEDNSSTLSLSRNGRQISDPSWDTISIQTCATLPPGYSTLSSRRSSVETLPPAYNDAVEDGSSEG